MFDAEPTLKAILRGLFPVCVSQRPTLFFLFLVVMVYNTNNTYVSLFLKMVSSGKSVMENKFFSGRTGGSVVVR